MFDGPGSLCCCFFFPPFLPFGFGIQRNFAGLYSHPPVASPITICLITHPTFRFHPPHILDPVPWNEGTASLEYATEPRFGLFTCHIQLLGLTKGERPNNDDHAHTSRCIGLTLAIFFVRVVLPLSLSILRRRFSYLCRLAFLLLHLYALRCRLPFPAALDLCLFLAVSHAPNWTSNAESVIRKGQLIPDSRRHGTIYVTGISNTFSNSAGTRLG